MKLRRYTAPIIPNKPQTMNNTLETILSEPQDRLSLESGNRILQEARSVLKQEFIGMDAIIDRVADAVLPWLMFPELNGRPTIINLWGMTGVGKSSLVNRLVQLLGFEQRFFRFDLGTGSHTDRSIQTQLSDLFPHHHGRPLILAFDEFQHARTLNESDQEVDKGYIRTIWEILDSGRFQTSFHSRSQGTVFELLYSLADSLRAGVVIEKGMVVAGADRVRKVRLSSEFPDSDDFNENQTNKTPGQEKPRPAVSNYYLDDILAVSLGRFRTEHEVRQHLHTLDGPELLALLYDIYERSLIPQSVDCRQALVFVMGNLDEAYPMSHNLNPDISADEFHLQSLRINVSNIRRALSTRFRMEQIARLGNCHIIYPAFSRNSYERIIRKELDSITRKAQHYGLDLRIDGSVSELLYREGVVPTQGIRPLLATIQEIVGTQLARMVVERVRLGHDRITVQMRWANGVLKKIFLHQDQPLSEQEEVLQLSMEGMRKARRDDLQAITAVHESGHAVLAIALLSQIPESVHSVTATDDSNGFVFLRESRGVSGKRDIIGRVAVLMGGLAAERIVFGEDHTTTGSESDLSRATTLVNGLIQESGLGGDPGAYANPVKADVHAMPNSERQHRLAEAWLREGFELAAEELQRRLPLLLRMADRLSDQPVLMRDDIVSLVRLWGTDLNIDRLLSEQRPTPYRDRLKGLVGGTSETLSYRLLTDHIMMNQDKCHASPAADVRDGSARV